MVFDYMYYIFFVICIWGRIILNEMRELCISKISATFFFVRENPNLISIWFLVQQMMEKINIFFSFPCGMIKKKEANRKFFIELPYREYIILENIS